MVALYVGATVAASLQYLRLRDRKLLSLALLFAFAAANRFFGDRPRFALWCDILSCGTGLVLLYLLSPRHHLSRAQ